MEENEHQPREYWSIDIAQENNLEEVLEPGPDCCIYRVPQYLCKLNEETFTPKLISIGPFHYGRKELMGMENQKRRYWLKFWERVNAQKLEEFKSYIENQEQRIRAHYSVTSTLQSSKYVAMILHDAVFIIELFIRSYHFTDDFFIDSPSTVISTTIDLLLLENQVPYFVLNDLYTIAFPPTISEGEPSFFCLSVQFFGGVVNFNRSLLLVAEPQVKNFTDLVRLAFVMAVQQVERIERIKGRIFDLPNATKLNNSGLNFCGIKDKCYLDISLVWRRNETWLPCFAKKELQIPCIEIYDETEGLFLNMMALELFHYPRQTHICDYVHLLGCLIKTVKDVDLFVKKGIIVNCVGDNEAIMKMFNRLGTYMISNNSRYYDIAKEMKKHYLNPSNYAKATLTDKVTFAAAFLMILTVIQTICSIKQVL